MANHTSFDWLREDLSHNVAIETPDSTVDLANIELVARSENGLQLLVVLNYRSNPRGGVKLE